jgi:hypothetical protein
MLLMQVPMPAPRTRIEGASAHTLTAVPCASTVAHSPAVPASVMPRPVITSTRPSVPTSGRQTNAAMMMPIIMGHRAIAAARGLSPSAVWKNSEMT